MEQVINIEALNNLVQTFEKSLKTEAEGVFDAQITENFTFTYKTNRENNVVVILLHLRDSKSNPCMVSVVELTGDNKADAAKIGETTEYLVKYMEYSPTIVRRAMALRRRKIGSSFSFRFRNETVAVTRKTETEIFIDIIPDDTNKEHKTKTVHIVDGLPRMTGIEAAAFIGIMLFNNKEDSLEKVFA